MVYLVLLVLAAAFFSATFVLSILLIEAFRIRGWTLTRRWRIAVSKRKKINEALQQSSDAQAQA